MALQKMKCKQALGHILDKASLSVLESCMMQMEILMKMKALGRIKAYNLVQMFQFMMKHILSEDYWILLITYLTAIFSSKYKGLLEETFDKSFIIVVHFSKKMFTVKSSKTSVT